eukprot:TRINITY_DN6760_c0_g2_i1.p1 TRINITY_DN6760_c0_g2~~TRINITY_DN6760_c0_g2_i1.p1  ORF type:complete len:600 (+),score=109.62 TRINITY_DN6760_c0_g2_i1:70-1800(+)
MSVSTMKLSISIFFLSLLHFTSAINQLRSSGLLRKPYPDNELGWLRPKLNPSGVKVGDGLPCSTANNVTINVKKLKDFSKRLRYPNNRLVILNLQADIVVSNQSIIFNDSFSCTIVKTEGGPRTHWINGTSDQYPVMLINLAQNILFYGVNFLSPTNADSSICPPEHVTDSISQPCAAVWIAGSWGIQVTQGIIYGSVQPVNHAYFVRIDGNTFHVAGGNTGIITAYVGVGNYLISSQITISNNKFYTKEALLAVTMIRQSAGVSVVNNYFENFNFTSVACGTGVSSVGDCVQMLIARNLIVNNYLKDSSNPGDSSGIYFDTHWAAPGNVLQCNYIVGGDHCLYIDYCSSGITVDGLICINTTNGIKLNTGSRNVLKGVVLVNGGKAAALSCQNYQTNNCLMKPGYCWGLKMEMIYQSDEIKQQFPWMSHFCEQTSVEYKGTTIPCNDVGDDPPTVTGNCSGIPVLNEFELVGVTDEANTSPFLYASCDTISAVQKTTDMAYYQTTAAEAKFIDPANGDYGIADAATSSIMSQFPSFRSCPRSEVGPKDLSFATYMKMFNTPKPSTPFPPQPYYWC